MNVVANYTSDKKSRVPIKMKIAPGDEHEQVIPMTIEEARALYNDLRFVIPIVERIRGIS